MTAEGKWAFVPYLHGWPLGVYYSAQAAADALGVGRHNAVWYTYKSSHEKADRRKDGGRLIMKVKLDERTNDGD